VNDSVDLKTEEKLIESKIGGDRTPRQVLQVLQYWQQNPTKLAKVGKSQFKHHSLQAQSARESGQSCRGVIE
jgi:hypothetical protein